MFCYIKKRNDYLCGLWQPKNTCFYRKATLMIGPTLLVMLECMQQFKANFDDWAYFAVLDLWKKSWTVETSE